MTWHIWITRNKVIFEDHGIVTKIVILNILEQLQIHIVTAHPKYNKRLNGLEPFYDFPVNFFDGASTNKTGGTGVHLILSKEHFFCLKMGYGLSTNTQSKLLALWVLLVFSKNIGLPYLHIWGDSTAIINWFNGQAALSALELQGWCHNIRDLQSSFIHLESSHVYREFNVKENGLSKEALYLTFRCLHFMEFIEGECSGKGSFKLH